MMEKHVQQKTAVQKPVETVGARKKAWAAVIVNAIIFALVAYAAVHMIRHTGGGTLTSGGFEAFKYYTVDSNILAGLASLVSAVYGAKCLLGKTGNPGKSTSEESAPVEPEESRKFMASGVSTATSGFAELGASADKAPKPAPASAASAALAPEPLTLAAAPRWLQLLKLAGTAAVSLTFLVVVFFLVPITGFNVASMYQGSNFYMHLVVPILAVAVYVLLERPARHPRRELLWCLIPTVAYEIFYAANAFAHLENGTISFEHDWYHFLAAGPASALIVAPLILAIAFVIILAVNRLACKTSKPRRQPDGVAGHSDR